LFELLDMNIMLASAFRVPDPVVGQSHRLPQWLHQSISYSGF